MVDVRSVKTQPDQVFSQNSSSRISTCLSLKIIISGFIVRIGHKFWRILKMYKRCTKEEHSPSEFYYPDEETEATLRAI